ncbi:penicillin-binding protein activator [Thalassotalea ponticola]|uniref:penicillin-binding protein activator n=1 Tax=Thalassotalea ponticola TaxID=1523392 RepID=UPI0025B312EB|nr:penicillin-binding protein activator [Thalassotalea ponticola]MDN3653543.1 penicillin-binding protein activator [Thalassotalea ponticola]
MSTKKTPHLRLNLSFAALASVLLFSCASPEKEPEPVPEYPLINEIPVAEPEQDDDANALLDKAEQASVSQAIVYLLQSSRLFINEQQYGKSLHIANQLSRLPLSPSQSTYNRLNSAHALYELGEYELAQQQLKLIEQRSPTQRELRLRGQVNEQLDMPVEAILAYLSLVDRYPSQDVTDSQHLFDLITSLQPWQKKALSEYDTAHLKGWLALDQAIAKSNANPAAINDALSQWQRDYQRHPGRRLLAQISSKVQTMSNQPTIDTVAVLLPLSGREKRIGETIQAGILAAYQGEQSIHFIDTNTTSMANIVKQLQSLTPDVVIGPLLKHHVDSYLQLAPQQATRSLEPLAGPIVSDTLLTPNPAVRDDAITRVDNTDNLTAKNATQGLYPWQTLLLNLPDQQTIGANQYALSMLPEDEAKQAAFTLSKKGFKNAMVLSQDNAIGKRMAQTFAQQWQTLTGHDITIVYYPEGKKMQSSVKSSLDVALSDQRIYQLRNRIKENVKAEARSRRDIDMIYLIANADQARLVKPYIDVNISPFANAIPVFASSRSHDRDADTNTRRDLRGVTFTDAPWLIPGASKDQVQYAQAQQLWPNRSSQMARLYAMGIDSINLLDKLRAMKLLPSIIFEGETGTWKLDQQGVFHRSLGWAKFRSSRISAIAME